MSFFNVSEYISCILINNENTSSGKWLTFVKTTLLPGHNGVSVVASLPTNQSRDVTANIPIYAEKCKIWLTNKRNYTFIMIK